MAASSDVRDACKGRWREVLIGVGIPRHHLRKNVSCPMCGGKDRFSFSDKNGEGTWFCRGCGSGGGIDLVFRYRRLKYWVEALDIIRPLIGLPPFRRRWDTSARQ